MRLRSLWGGIHQVLTTLTSQPPHSLQYDSGGGAIDVNVVAPRRPTAATAGSAQQRPAKRQRTSTRKGVLHVGITDSYPVAFHVPGAKKHAKAKLDAMSRSL